MYPLQYSPVPHLRSAKDWLKNIFYGLCIGASDIVPGFSGGTMAFILGIYENLIHSIKSFSSREAFAIFRGKFTTFINGVSWDFLGSILIGIVTALALLSQVVHYLLGHEVYRVYLFSLFLGMIGASVVIVMRHVRDFAPWHVIFLVGGVLTAYALTGVNHVSDGGNYNVNIPINQLNVKTELLPKTENYNRDEQMLLGISKNTISIMLAEGIISRTTNIVDAQTGQVHLAGEFVKPKESYWINPWLIMCGAIAITAMLLPGISGSYLLTILGAYPIVIAALADFSQSLFSLSFDLKAFLVLANLEVGIIIGAILFSRVISWFLQHYHTAALTMLLGFMIGSTHVVWPFWHYRYLLDPLRIAKGPQLHAVEPYVPSYLSWMFWKAIVVVFIGLILVIFVEGLAKKKSLKQKEEK